MKLLSAAAEILLSFLVITLIFILLNDSTVFPWKIMEKFWLCYLPLLSFFVSFCYRRHYSLTGGGIFLSFCFIAPAVVFSYYASLPWGYLFFQPILLLITGFFSILGEGFYKIFCKKIEKNAKV